MTDFVPEFGALTKAKRSGEREAAAGTLPVILGLVGPVRALVQVGVGGGAWLAEAMRLGVSDVAGLEGGWCEPSDGWPPGVVTTVDYTRSFAQDRSWDLCLCLEVAEHLPQARAASFVADLTRLAPVIAFSAAIPGQGGEGHVNEQWPAYWERLFADQQFHLVDAVRPVLWPAPKGPAYLAQNLLLAVSAPALAGLPELARIAAEQDTPVRSLVHPDIWSGAVRPTLGVRGAAEALASAIRLRARRSLSRTTRS